MGCSNSVDVNITTQQEAEQGTGQYKIDYFGVHGRAVGMRFVMHYCGKEFVDTRVSIPMGFVKRKVCGPMKYGSLPKLILPNGTELHQTLSATRYMGRAFKGCNGEVLYPEDPMNRYWIDIALERSNSFV